MNPRIEANTETKLVGMRMRMSLSNNKTFALWNGLMKRQGEIENRTNNDKYSMQIYDSGHFEHFNPEKEFEKWAAVPVASFENVPPGMDIYTLPKGLYAVFIHLGGPKKGPETFGYIFRTWLPHSGYVLDNRPHFEILGDKYKNDGPDSEEEIWIPIKPKS